MNYVKQIITDTAELGDWSTEIDPRKEGKLLQEIVLSLKNTMRENNLIYLTAPQIGYKRRVFCLRFGESDYRTFVNPLIENNIAFQFVKETCNSIPGKTYIRPRFGNIKVLFMSPLGKASSSTLAGQAAIIFQHCLDHLDGLLLSDVGLELTDDFDKYSEDEKAEILKGYAESLDIKQKDLQKEIQSDTELKQVNDAIDFMNSVKEGKTQLDLQAAKK